MNHPVGPAFRDQPIPQQVQRECPLGNRGQPFGADDLRPQIDQSGLAIGPRDAARAVQHEIGARACTRRGQQQQRGHLRLRPRSTQVHQRIAPRPDRIGVQRENRTLAQQRQRLTQPAAGFQNFRLP